MKRQKIISILLSLAILVYSGLGNYAYALPTAPSAPSAPTTPTEPTAPSSPTAPSAPNAPGANTEGSNTESENTNNQPTPTPTNVPSATPTVAPTSTPTPTPKPTTTPSANATVVNTADNDDTGSTSSDGNLGDTTIETGTANSAGVVTNDLNKNVSAGVSSNPSGIAVVNDGNATGSSNTGSAKVTNDSLTLQDNTAKLVNNYDGYADSGNNSASKNNLGDSTIKTGDANTSGTILNTVNTNADGIMISEFNIVDDQMGDYVLDFAANCISGCGNGSLNASNSNNSADSTNTAVIDSQNNSATFQTNDAEIENNMTLTANSGYNEASKNNQGDSSIETGDANVNATVLNFANNNIAGKIIYGVVNIFGDLVGDIIMPESTGCCSNGVTATNSDNGAGSENNILVDQSINDETYQFNNANIENNLMFETETGSNEVSKNNQGNNKIVTGDSSIDAQVLNIANTNTVGDMWLVLVNEAGNWIGKILGGSGDGNVAGSEGWEFQVNENGEILAQNIGNGPGSENTTVIGQTTNSQTVQTNNANIVNNINLNAVTGKNDASKNNGGDSTIKTGDAEIIATIANFVNNNIKGTGRLFVTTVNVFGSWLGDFVTPGSKKNQNEEQAIGGSNYTGSENSNSSSGNSSNSNSNNTAVTEVASFEIKNVDNPAVLSYATTSAIKEETDEDLLALAGTNDIVAAAQIDSKKSVNINLAWLLFLLPVFIVLRIVKRRKALSYTIAK